MVQEAWKDKLRNCFDDLRIIERCKLDASRDFAQFCEFIVEPAFESLIDEFKGYGIKAKFQRLKGNQISLRINFPGSRVDNFHYTIFLPKNSLELKLRLKIRGRKSRKSPYEEYEEIFMKGIDSSKVLKLEKEELIEDVIEYYKDFNLKALTSKE